MGELIAVAIRADLSNLMREHSRCKGCSKALNVESFFSRRQVALHGAPSPTRTISGAANSSRASSLLGTAGAVVAARRRHEIYHASPLPSRFGKQIGVTKLLTKSAKRHES